MNERIHRPDNDNRHSLSKYSRHSLSEDSDHRSTPYYANADCNLSWEEIEEQDDEIFNRFCSESYKPKNKDKPFYHLNRSNPDYKYQSQYQENEVVAQTILAPKNAPKSEKLSDARINPNTKQQKQSQTLIVANLSATDKLGEAMKRAAMKLPKAVGVQLLAMVNPTSLTIMVGVLGAYAASHAVGVGVIADAVMAVGAGATIGWQAVSAGKDLWGFAQFINATTEEDLDKAGQHLASFISTVGIDIVIGILTKKATGKIGKNVNSNSRSVTDGVRNTEPLTTAQIDEIKQYAKELDIPEETLRFTENMDTSYGNMFGHEIVYVSPNIAPNPNPRISGITANDRISIKGSLAHEWVGHGASGRAGRAFDRGTIGNPNRYNIALDEAQASIRAARFAPGLTPLERYILLRDGIARLRKMGINLRDVKHELYIDEP